MAGVISKVLVTRSRYILLAIVVSLSFIVYYNAISPSNFSSFSSTIRYYVPALGTLLAIVVSFNTLALQNQLKDMPIGIEILQRQLDKVDILIPDVLKKRNKDNEKEIPNTFEKSSDYFIETIKNTIIILKEQAEYFIKEIETCPANFNKIDDMDKRGFYDICKKIVQEYDKRLSLYKKTKSSYNLIRISTISYIYRLQFNSLVDNNNEATEFFENFKRVHILKGICYRIYLRNSLADLSYELLISTIPIIGFVGIIASISNYNDYSISLIRSLFALSISIVAVPFVLLFTRTIPILHLIKDSPVIPSVKR